jgi:hypothetical protein
VSASRFGGPLVLAVPAIVGAAAASDDTLGRIAAHRDATRLVEKAGACMGEAEREIPDDRRKALEAAASNHLPIW